MHNITRTANVNGTSLRGIVTTTFNKLKEVFGFPCINNPPSKFEKVTTEWCLRFPCGTVATIYNWKNYGTDPAVDENYSWHVGGHNADALRLVVETLKKNS